MKFFIPLGFRDDISRPGDTISSLSSVYGPYEDDKAIDEAIARFWPNDKEEEFLVFDGQIVKAKPSAKEKPEDQKRAPGDLNNYVKDKEGYKCKDCGSSIVGATVAHPIHFRQMRGVGAGECQTETVLYCPNCEKKPNFHGDPVYYS